MTGLKGTELKRLADLCSKLLQEHIDGRASLPDEKLLQLAEFIEDQRKRGITDEKCLEAVDSKVNPMNGRPW